MSPGIGIQAPEFTLYDSEKNRVSLSDFKGKNVLILFFPLAFTRVCTAELCQVRDNINVYQNLQVEILAISVDSLYTLAKYKSQENLNFTLLSDFNKEVSILYNSYYDVFSYGMRGVSKRSAFLVDKEGVIKYMEVLEDAGQVPQISKIEELLAKMVNG
jgi:peroxiredoxin